MQLVSLCRFFGYFVKQIAESYFCNSHLSSRWYCIPSPVGNIGRHNIDNFVLVDRAIYYKLETVQFGARQSKRYANPAAEPT